LGVVLPTVRNQVLFVFLLLALDRRRALHFKVTANPAAAWTAQQIVEAFPWQHPAKYLLRGRDKIYGKAFRERVTGIGLEEVLTAARSPRQNPYVERLIGTIRRDCLDHVIVVRRKTPSSDGVTIAAVIGLDPAGTFPERCPAIRPAMDPRGFRPRFGRGKPCTGRRQSPLPPKACNFRRAREYSRRRQS
jgi:hypothetical protein